VSIIPHTFRFQLLLVLTLAIAPLAGLAVYLALDEGRRDSERAKAEARSAVHLVSQDLSRLIQGSRDLVWGFSRNSAIQDHPEICSAMLAKLRPSFPQFDNMGWSTRVAGLCARPFQQRSVYSQLGRATPSWPGEFVRPETWRWAMSR